MLNTITVYFKSKYVSRPNKYESPINGVFKTRAEMLIKNISKRSLGSRFFYSPDLLAVDFCDSDMEALKNNTWMP